MRANLSRLSALIRQAQKATLFERATLAMVAVDTAAAALWEMAERIEQLEDQLKGVGPAKGGES